MFRLHGHSFFAPSPGLPKFVLPVHHCTIERMLGWLRGSTIHAGVTKKHNPDFAEVSWKPRRSRKNEIVSTAYSAPWHGWSWRSSEEYSWAFIRNGFQICRGHGTPISINRPRRCRTFRQPSRPKIAPQRLRKPSLRPRDIRAYHSRRQSHFDVVFQSSRKLIAGQLAL